MMSLHQLHLGIPSVYVITTTALIWTVAVVQGVGDCDQTPSSVSPPLSLTSSEFRRDNWFEKTRTRRLKVCEKTIDKYVRQTDGQSCHHIVRFAIDSRDKINQQKAFYPNVTTLRSGHVRGLCCRNSVCLSSVVCRLSVCLSSVVCNVNAPYSGGWTFRQNFFIAVYAGYPLTSVQNFTEIVLGEPLRRGR